MALSTIFEISMAIVSYGLYREFKKAITTHSILKKLNSLLPDDIDDVNYIDRFDTKARVFLGLSIVIWIINTFLMGLKATPKHGWGMFVLAIVVSLIMTTIIAGLGSIVFPTDSKDDYSNSEKRKMREMAKGEILKEIIRDSYSRQHAELIISLINKTSLDFEYDSINLNAYANKPHLVTEVSVLINTHIKNASNKYITDNIELALLETKNSATMAYLLNIVSIQKYREFLDTPDGEPYAQAIARDLVIINSQLIKVARETEEVEEKTRTNKIKTELDGLRNNRFDTIEDMIHDRSSVK